MRKLTLALAGAGVALLAAVVVYLGRGEPEDGTGDEVLVSRRVRVATPRPLDHSERVEERLDKLRALLAQRQAAAGGRQPMVRKVATAIARGRGGVEDALDDTEAGGKDTVEQLKQTALGDADPDERIVAIVLLGAEEGPEVMPVLLEALKDPDPEVRLTALQTLGERTEELTADMLATAMRDRDAEVRFEAVGMLGDMETPEALEYLRTAKDDPDEDVRGLAEGILDFAAAEGQIAPEQGGIPSP